MSKRAKWVGVTQAGQRVGETHHRAKLSDRDVELILQMHEWGLSYQQIADKLDDIEGGVAKSTVRDIVKGRIRASLPERFKRCG